MVVVREDSNHSEPLKCPPIMKNILVVLLLTCSFCVEAQPPTEGIYEVFIFQWTEKDSLEKDNIVSIDSVGNISFNNKATEVKVDLVKFNNAVNDFLSKEKVIKIEPSNNPPAEARKPQNNTKNVFLSIVRLEDFKKDKDFNSPTTFCLFKYDLNLNDFGFPFFDYLTKKDRNKIIGLLKQ